MNDAAAHAEGPASESLQGKPRWGNAQAVPAATLCRFGGLSAELSCAGVKGCLPQMQVRWLAAEVKNGPRFCWDASSPRS